MSYNHLNTFERGKIEALNKLGYSARKIAIELGRNHSTISRELKRLGSFYTSELANQDYKIKRLNSIYKGKFTNELKVLINEHLDKTWSPEQIVNTVAKGLISFKTIYNWIYSEKLNKCTILKLRRKGKSRSPKETRGKFLIGKSIKSRPKEIKERTTFGHCELDTVVSSRGKSKGCFATFLERRSRLYIAIKIPDRTSESMKKAIIQVKKALPKNAFKTATVDRGKEFACYADMEKELGIDVYFADSYSSWQRGSNENSNGLIRDFYPKKTDLAKVDNDELVKNLFIINSRPRKCLGWKTPIQCFLEEVLHLT